MKKIRFLNFIFIVGFYCTQPFAIYATAVKSSAQIFLPPYLEPAPYIFSPFPTNGTFSPKNSNNFIASSQQKPSSIPTSPLPVKKSSKKAFILKVICGLAGFALISTGAYFCWKYFSQTPQSSSEVLPPSVLCKPTSVITGHSSVEEKIHRHLLQDTKQLKIDGGHSHDAYITALEKESYLFNVRELIIDKVGNVKRVHTPHGKFEDFNNPELSIQKEQQHLRWQDFRRIAEIPALQNVEYITLRGFEFVQLPHVHNSQLEIFKHTVEIAANHTTLRDHFPNLQSLRLEGCTIDHRFASILEHHPLKKFELVNSSVSHKTDLPVILKTAKHTSLTCFTAVGCQLDDATAHKILVSSALKKVEDVDFSHNNLSLDFLFKSFSTLFKTKKISAQLTQISVSGTPLLEQQIDSKEFDSKIKKVSKSSVFQYLKDHPETQLNIGPLAQASPAQTTAFSHLKTTLGSQLQYQ